MVTSEVMPESESSHPSVYMNGGVPITSSDLSISTLQAELDALKAELHRVQIESETDLNESNSRVLQLESKLTQQSQLQTQLDASVQEVNRLKEALKTRVGNDSDSQKQVSQLESEKNDLLGVVRDAQKDYADLEVEFQANVERLNTAKLTIRNLESDLTTSREAERAASLRAQALEADSRLITADRDFYVKELEQTRDGWQKFRTESHQEITKLQTDLDKLTHSHQHVTTSFSTLQTQHSELQKHHSDATEKIRDLTNQIIEAEASFQKEIDIQKRVTELMDKRDKHRGQRMEEIETEWNSRRAELEEREKAIDEELARERTRYEELEKKLAETKAVLENVCASNSGALDFADEEHSAGDVTFGPNTPGSPLFRRQKGSGLPNGLSPAAAMVSQLQKGGKSLTQIYTEKIQLEEQMTDLKVENLRLSECLATIMGEIQDKAPVIQQQRVEAERIRFESDQLTTELTRTIEQKEEAERKYESCLIDLRGLERDRELSNHQLHDLSLQLRVLTKELVIRERGDKFGLAGNENDLMDHTGNDPLSLEDDADDLLLSNDLVTFKDIAELQHKNLKLLEVARKLTTKLQELESDRATGADEDDYDAAATQAVEEAHELILRLKADLETAQRKGEALSRERDMLRRMLQQSQQSSVQSEGVLMDTEAKIMAGPQRQYEELHSQFEAYKTEIGADAKRINEDLNRARADLSQTQVSLAKANAQIEYLNERYRNIDQTNAMQTQEIQTLTKTSIKLQEQLVRSGERLHQANEIATELKSKCTVLEHQVQSLTTEKEVWKGVEGRLSAENASLARERNNLSDILSNMQSMHGEMERNSSDLRRRAENQVTKLEARIQELKDKLKSESDDVKQVTLQRELDNRDFQMRLDKLNAEHLIARETLVAAHTAQEHLEAKVKDLSKQLSAKEDRLNIYEGPRLPTNAQGDAATRDDATHNHGLSQEKKLEIEISQLKREVVAAKEESVKAKEHVEQFKAIAESAEAALASLTATHDEYKQAQEAELARKQTTIAALEEQMKKVTEELAAACAQTSELQQQVDSQRADFEKEKASLLTRLGSLEDIETRAKTREDELRTEADQQRTLVQVNHDRYQAEVQNHAISLSELTTLKEQLEKARAKITSSNTTAETAMAKLQASEASWAEQKVTLKKEIESISNRCEDLTNQNNLLHQHLETVSAQAAQLSNKAIDSAAGTGDGAIPEHTDESNAHSTEQLRGVIRYLRNNIDIAQQQLALTKMESTRLHQQLQHASKALDQTRSELLQERERSRQGYVSSAEYSQLLDQINTLNMVRESNATLRDESIRSDRKAKELEMRLQQTNATLDPLKNELRELKASVQQYQQEITLLTEDNERWKARNQQILEKYDRIDPAEVQSLRDEIAKAEVDKTQIWAEVTKWKEKFLLVQAQARNSREKLIAAKDAAEAVCSTLSGELNTLKESLKKVESHGQEQQATIDILQRNKTELERTLADAMGYKAQVSELENASVALKAEVDKLQALLTSSSSKNAVLLADNKRMNAINKQVSSEIEQLNATASLPPVASMSDEAIEAEVTKRVDAKLAMNISQGEPGEVTSTEELIQSKLDEARSVAVAEREAAVEQAIESTTQKLTAEFEASKEAAIAKLKLEFAETNSTTATATAPNSSEEAINTLVSDRVSKIKAELEAAAEAKQLEIIAKHEVDLKAAVEAATKQVPTPSQPIGYSEEQLQESIKSAVTQAVKTKEEEILRAHKVEMDAAVESTKMKTAAEGNSKSNVTQMQLKRAQGQLIELRKKLAVYESGAVPTATGSAPAPNVVSTTVAPTAVPVSTAPLPVMMSATDVTPAVVPPVISPIPSFTGDATPRTFNGAEQSKVTSQNRPVTFGNPNKRGIPRGGRGRGQAPAGAMLPTPGPFIGRRVMTGASTLPQEGRMSTKPNENTALPIKPIAGGAPGGGTIMAIRGAASKRGGNLLEAAVKAATSSTASTPNEATTTEASNPMATTAAKRAREEESGQVQMGTEGGDGNVKRVKAVGDGGGVEEVNNPGELASRLSKRVN